MYHNFKWEGGGKRETEKAGHKESWTTLPPFPRFLILSLQRKSSGVRVLGGYPGAFCEDTREAAEFRDRLPEAARGGDCQWLDNLSGGPDGLAGRMRVNSAVARPPYTPAVSTYAA